MKKHLLILLICFASGYCLFSQTILKQYRVDFTDKKGSSFTIDNPEEFLSRRAIERREAFGISITEEDLPVSETYTDSLQTYGIKIYCKSKWFNSVVIGVYSDTVVADIKALSFVDTVVFVAPERVNKKGSRSAITDNKTFHSLTFSPDSLYGDFLDEASFVNGTFLHKKGYWGEGVLMAVLDAGFQNVDSIKGFRHLYDDDRIISAVDFVGDSVSVYEAGNHGTHVFSMIAALEEGLYVGAAPKASFVLLRTEDANTEYIVEEEYWIAGAEYADSIGADIITASLGYSLYDDSTQSHTYSELDGQSIRISKAANMAFDKGIFVVESAGNYGNKTWKYVGAPADAQNVLAVGATWQDSTIADFSSRGYSFDGRIKPDVSTKGVLVSVYNTSGTVDAGSGTSFAAPYIAGFIACLYEAFNKVEPSEVKNAVLQSADRYFYPDSIYGYGIPDFEKAYIILSDFEYSGISLLDDILVYPNPFDSSFRVNVYTPEYEGIIVELYNLQGEKCFEQSLINEASVLFFEVNIPEQLKKGTYFLRVIRKNSVFIRKLVKL